MAARKTTRTKCPNCGRDGVVPIVYGLPTSETFEAAERGEFELGGCIIEPGQAHRRCLECGWDDGETVPDGELRL